jgi:hypothetical protein
MKKLLTVLTLTAALVACGNEKQSSSETVVLPVNDDLIKEVQITKVDQVEFPMTQSLGWESDCTKLDRVGDPKPASDDLTLDQIINLGQKVWQMIKDNEPILEARGMTASALPAGLRCWNELSNWAPARAETYEVKYVNLYGITVINFKFRLLYSYGGSYKGQGRYLTNSTIQYSNVDVMWGYIFNADVEIPQVLNMGSTESPLAGMQLTVNWSVNTRPLSLKKSVNSSSFFIGGDGRPTKILN